MRGPWWGRWIGVNVWTVRTLNVMGENVMWVKWGMKGAFVGSVEKKCVEVWSIRRV